MQNWICHLFRLNCAKTTANLQPVKKTNYHSSIKRTDLRGALHNHSTWSDGHNRPEEIAEYMEELGLEYWAITDHSKSSFQANGSMQARSPTNQGNQNNQRAACRTAAEFRLLTGIEVDILRDRLDFDDELLMELDVVVASLHVPSNNEAENTKRLIRAAENKFVHIIGH